jgi:putative peptide zinc metalloprotease protein
MDKLRTDLKIIREVQSGEVAYLVKDPVAQKYYRFGAAEYAVIEQFDGTRNYDEIARQVKAEAGIKVTAAAVEGFAASLKQLNLIERSAREKSLLLLEHLRQERKQAATHGRDVLYMRFPAVDPDRVYNRLIKYIGFCWSRPFVIGCFVLFALAATIIITHWETVSAGLAARYAFEGKGAGDVLLFVCVIFFVVFCHENGHGLTCKYYGGEVHELGFMLIYFMPACYANVTDAWSFASKAAKLWVTFAGIFVELIICSLASFVWYFTAPGYATHELAFTFMLVAGLSSALFNLNPLIKLDGYFALVDYLEVPNLSDEAAKYVSALVRRHVFRSSIPVPVYQPRVKRVLLIYGVLAMCYRATMLVFVLAFFYRQISAWFPELGVFIFPFVAYRLLRQKLTAWWRGLHNLWRDKREALMRPKSLVTAGAALTAALALFFFLPLPTWRQTTFVIEPSERVLVRASGGGFIARVLAREGATVRRGATLAVLRDHQLEQQREALRAQLAVSERQILRHRAAGMTAQALAEERHRAQANLELAELEARLARLVTAAPSDGIVVTRGLEDRVGALLRAGDEFCELAAAGALRASAPVDDWYLTEVAVGAPASLWLRAAPGQAIRGRVVSLAPASHLHQRFSPAATSAEPREDEPKLIKASMVEASGANNQLSARASMLTTAEATSPFATPLVRFEARIAVEAGAELKPGMTGEVKIYGPRRPLALSVWYAVRDWFRSQVWW